MVWHMKIYIWREERGAKRRSKSVLHLDYCQNFRIKIWCPHIWSAYLMSAYLMSAYLVSAYLVMERGVKRRSFKGNSIIFEYNLGYRGYPHFFSIFFDISGIFPKNILYPQIFFSNFCQKIWNFENFLATPKKIFWPPKNFLATPKKFLDPQKIFLATPKKIFGAKNFWVPPEIFRFKGNSFVFEFCLVWREFLCIWVLSRWTS